MVQIKTSRLISAKQLSKPILTYRQLDFWETNFNEIRIKIQQISFMERNLKYRLQNGHFLSAPVYQSTQTGIVYFIAEDLRTETVGKITVSNK